METELNSDKKMLTLNNGKKMPRLGLGMFLMEEKKMQDVIINAIKIGYRHFDCAADYGNEAEVGEAFKAAIEEGLVKREDLFVTSKLWNSDHGNVLDACEESLKRLQFDYLDLYLVHFPIATEKHIGGFEIDTTTSLEDTWRDMEKLVSKGKVRSIGISNYDVFLTRDCLAYSKIKPAVNQIETNPYFQRSSLVEFCQKHKICVTAHTPLGGGSLARLDDPVLKKVAEEHEKTVAQVVLRWGIQRNTVVIPKTSNHDRLKENFEVLDFELTKEDMEDIEKIDKKDHIGQMVRAWGP